MLVASSALSEQDCTRPWFSASKAPQRLGISVKPLIQDDRGISVSFSDGSTSRHNLVVGADGIASSLDYLVTRW
jgi:2-polyprenyl-6-methoxyphenol hydroxylase-like FAD-dependent oxidoreductase